MAIDTGLPSKTLIYYGMEIPSISASRASLYTNVVMQAYNPLCFNGYYEKFFPNAERFVYWNPARIPVAEVGTMPIRSADGVLANIDLSVASSREFVIQRALEVMKTNGAHGLFVDDMDHWCITGEDRVNALSLLTDARIAGIPFFLNRAFPLAPSIKNLKAVLLENLSAEDIKAANSGDLAWYESFVKLHLPVLKNRQPKTDIVALTYKTGSLTGYPDTERRDALIAMLNSFTDETVFSEISLNTLPPSLIG